MAEYTCYDLMHIFHDTLITVIKINDLARPDKEGKTKYSTKVLPSRFSFFSPKTKVIASYNKYMPGEKAGIQREHFKNLNFINSAFNTKI